MVLPHVPQTCVARQLIARGDQTFAAIPNSTAIVWDTSLHEIVVSRKLCREIRKILSMSLCKGRSLHGHANPNYQKYFILGIT